MRRGWEFGGCGCGLHSWVADVELDLGVEVTAKVGQGGLGLQSQAEAWRAEACKAKQALPRCLLCVYAAGGISVVENQHVAFVCGPVQLVVIRGSEESPEWEEGGNRVLAAHGGRGGGRLAVTCAWGRPEETQVGCGLRPSHGQGPGVGAGCWELTCGS